MTKTNGLETHISPMKIEVGGVTVAPGREPGSEACSGGPATELAHPAMMSTTKRSLRDTTCECRT